MYIEKNRPMKDRKAGTKVRMRNDFKNTKVFLKGMQSNFLFHKAANKFKNVQKVMISLYRPSKTIFISLPCLFLGEEDLREVVRF
jgi:hypothetical protein